MMISIHSPWEKKKRKGEREGHAPVCRTVRWASPKAKKNGKKKEGKGEEKTRGEPHLPDLTMVFPERRGKEKGRGRGTENLISIH